MTTAVRPSLGDESDLDHADLVVVGGPDDTIAERVAAHAGTRGARVARASRTSLARHLTVEFDGDRATATPRVPLLLRAEHPAAPTNRFSAAEAHAHVWSAAAVMDAPVINRPSHVRGSDWPPRLYLPLLAGSSSFDPALLLDETYASRSPGSAADFQIQILAPSAAHSADWCAVRYRRRAAVEPGYYRVVVVGDRHWATAEAPWAEGLAMRSVEAAAALGLTFCSVTWMRAADSSGPRLAKVTGHPSALSLGDLVEPVARALLDLLLP